jgi:hypothetical protein
MIGAKNETKAVDQEQAWPMACLRGRPRNFRHPQIRIARRGCPRDVRENEAGLTSFRHKTQFEVLHFCHSDNFTNLCESKE